MYVVLEETREGEYQVNYNIVGPWFRKADAEDYKKFSEADQAILCSLWNEEEEE